MYHMLLLLLKQQERYNAGLSIYLSLLRLLLQVRLPVNAPVVLVHRDVPIRLSLLAAEINLPVDTCVTRG